MRRTLCTLALIALTAPLALPEEAARPGAGIEWVEDLPAAFAEAQGNGRPILICVNAEDVAGRKKEEPTAKGLREKVYADPRAVAKSRQFVCALLSHSGSSADYGELRALGISGLIVSPQHIFVDPSGTRVLKRREYWSYGSGESGVKALLKMMDECLASLETPAEPVPEAPEAAPDAEAPDTEAPDAEAPDAEAPDAPGETPPEVEAGEEHTKARTAWIERMLKQVDTGAAPARQTALGSLVRHDRQGDCIDPLIERIPELEKRVPVLVDVLRALGIPGLEKAAKPIARQLKHKDDAVRGNAAVTLEYIGAKTSLSALARAAEQEDEASIANHMYRALGRCGVGNAKVRALLLKRSMAGRSTFATYGPVIGLAYFEKDKRTARNVEKEFKKIGHPFGGRRSGRNSFKRALFMWCLSEIEDPKSGPWIREERIEPLENAESRYKDFVIGFYDAAARKCEGDTDESVPVTIREAMERYLGWRRDRTPLKDAYREGRDMSKFEPKMEFDAREDDD